VLAAWGELLERAITTELEALGREAVLPLHLREAPAIDPEGPDFVAQLLAPARSGVLLTRSDLARCARELGLGLRLGERRFALRALLEQDAPATLGWLALEARRQAALRGTGFWRKRALAASRLLASLSDISAREVAHAG
jgi:hypothetical protein